MIRFRLERRQDTPLYLQVVIPIAAVIVTLILCSGLVWLSGANVAEAYSLLLFSTFRSGYDIQDTLVKASPLLFTGLAVLVAFRAKFWNIGAEGQLMAGAIAACFIGEREWLPAFSLIPLMIVAAAIFGALWALLPALLKVKLKVDDVVTTLLLNFIMLYGVTALLEGPVARPEERLSELAVSPLRGGVSVPSLRQRPSRRAPGADRRDRRLVDVCAHYARIFDPRRRP